VVGVVTCHGEPATILTPPERHSNCSTGSVNKIYLFYSDGFIYMGVQDIFVTMPGTAHFATAGDESVRLEVETPDGHLRLVINPFDVHVSVHDAGIDKQSVSTERAAEILNDAADAVDPDALKTAFDLLAEHHA